VPSACVVFIGDSILSNWPPLQPPNEFSNVQIVNHGIPGDTASNMLARFRRDVVHLRPRVVVILGGLNDFARIPLSIVEQNLFVITQIAHEHKIQVVLATLPPAHKPNGNATAAATAGQDEIPAFNWWLKSFAERNHFAVADFYSTLADERGFYQTGLTYDGVHPTAEGYRRMEPLLRRAIQNAISNADSN
jgi:lysophospholipase L1-like esterase